VNGLTLKPHVSSRYARRRAVLRRLVVIYFIEGQEIRAIEFVVLNVEGAASFEPQSKSSDIWGFDIRLLDSLRTAVLALRVLRS
jgi:hypothetical protein